MARMALLRPGPKMAMMATASSKEGNAIMMSIRRMMPAPSILGKNAASNPSTIPGNRAASTENMPTSNDVRAPKSRRLSTSRPASSVPSKNFHDPPSCQAGARAMASRYCSIGLCGAIRGAKMAASTISVMKISPNVAPLFCRKDCASSRQGDSTSGASSAPADAAATGKKLPVSFMLLWRIRAGYFA